MPITTNNIMKNTTKLIILAVVVIAVALIMGSTDTTASSVGSAYTAKHYTSANASSTARTIVKGGAGELGSITINTTGAVPLRLYDAATSTAATSTLDAIAVIKASVGEQTFTYDASLLKGLTLEMPATYAGDITISVR